MSMNNRHPQGALFAGIFSMIFCINSATAQDSAVLAPIKQEAKNEAGFEKGDFQKVINKTKRLTSWFMPGIPVTVRFPSGIQVGARLMPPVQSGHIVKSGDVLPIRCELSTEGSLSGYQFGRCTLDFPRPAPLQKKASSFDFDTTQSSWVIGASEAGYTDPGLLRLNTPISWVLPLGEAAEDSTEVTDGGKD